MSNPAIGNRQSKGGTYRTHYTNQSESDPAAPASNSSKQKPLANVYPKDAQTATLELV